MLLLKNRLVKNMSWIIVAKIVQSAIGLVISILTARMLGPSNFGIINYAASVITFLVPLMQLGFNNILVFELKNRPDEEGKIIGSALTLSSLSSLLCIGAAVSFSLIANSGEKETIIVCALYSLLLFFQAFDLISYWFQAKLLSKYSSISSLIAYSIVAAYKVFLLATGKNIFWFAISNSIDYFLIAVLLFIFYKIKGGTKITFSKETAKRMLSESKYYILPGLMVAIYGHTDKVMLKLMVGNEVTGYYSTAMTCATMSGFVFSAIIDSFRPVIFESKKKGDYEGFEQKLSLLYNIVFYLAILQSLAMTLLSGPIINVLYGAEYAESSNILKVISWYIAFSYFGTVRNIWMLAEGKHKYLWIINLSGAIVNIALNYLLITFIGVIGAALASLATEFFCNFLFGFFFKPIRRSSFIMLKGLNPLYGITFYKQYKQRNQ